MPEIFDRHRVETALLVPEVDGIRMCRFVPKRYGILIGGSTGSVLAGSCPSLQKWRFPREKSSPSHQTQESDI